MTELAHVAREIRRDLILMAHRAQSPHIGSALSCVDILAALYFQYGRYLLIETIGRPYSYTLPESRFPRRIEVRDLTGRVLR